MTKKFKVGDVVTCYQYRPENLAITVIHDVDSYGGQRGIPHYHDGFYDAGYALSILDGAILYTDSMSEEEITTR